MEIIKCKCEFGCLLKRQFKKEIFEFDNSRELYADGAGIIVIDSKNRILLTQSYNCRWGIPKGKVEKDETIINCAQRELFEETGFNVEISNNNLMYVFENLYNSSKKISLFARKFSFIGKTKSKKFEDLEDAEITGIGWMNISCLKNNFDLKLNFITRKIVEHLYSFYYNSSKYNDCFEIINKTFVFLNNGQTHPCINCRIYEKCQRCKSLFKFLLYSQIENWRSNRIC